MDSSGERRLLLVHLALSQGEINFRLGLALGAMWKRTRERICFSKTSGVMVLDEFPIYSLGVL